jgi:hydroxymethylpyrimidine pyrophosphatase-like HAD family hydrolase
MPRPGLPKLIATDLDGTLVRSDDTVSPYARTVLDRVRAAGIPVVGATGRGPRLLDLTRRDIPAAGHLVLAGGGRVVDLTNGGPITLFDQRIDGPAVAGLIADLEAAVGPLAVMAEVLDDQDAPLWGDPDPDWPWPRRVKQVPRPEALAGPVFKALVRADGMPTDGLLQVAQQVIPPAVASLTQAGLGYVEICPPGVDKGTGLAVVASVLGVDPKDVLVFGDMPNDIPMFAWAGWGRVAVGNAHPSVLALADEVTLTNDQDGVAVWLDQLLSDGGSV